MSGHRRRSKRGGADASRAFRAAKAAYAKPGDDSRAIPEGMVPIGRTDTVTAYKDPNTGRLLIGVRGTQANRRDLFADALIPFNLLSKSKRYKQDKDFVAKILAENPGAMADVAGHSLGGTIASQLKRDFKDRVADVDTFNPAVQPIDALRPVEGTSRRYISGDPLHAIMGRFAPQTQVSANPDAEKKKPSWYLPGIVKTALGALQAHSLDNFAPLVDGQAGNTAQAPTSAAQMPRPPPPQPPSEYKNPLDAFGLAPRSGMY